MKTAVKKNMIYNNYIIHVFYNINIIIHVYMQEDKLFCQKTYNLIMKIAHPDIRFSHVQSCFYSAVFIKCEFT